VAERKRCGLVQGDCKGAPPAGLEYPTQTDNMCHLLIKEDLLQLPLKTVKEFWFDNLYFQVRSPAC
jgi:hypothetical protein